MVSGLRPVDAVKKIGLGNLPRLCRLPCGESLTHRRAPGIISPRLRRRSSGTRRCGPPRNNLGPEVLGQSHSVPTGRTAAKPLGFTLTGRGLTQCLRKESGYAIFDWNVSNDSLHGLPMTTIAYTEGHEAGASPPALISRHKCPALAPQVPRRPNSKHFRLKTPDSKLTTQT